MPLYHIKRNNAIVATIWPEGQQEKEIMVKDIVPISFKSPKSYQFQIGDTMEVYGQSYYLNQIDEPTKNSTLSYQYQMTFQAEYYKLAKPIMMFYDSVNALKLIKFEIMTNAKQLLDLIVANANRKQSGWVAGECIDSEFKMITFNGESVLTAIDNGAKDFNTEWWVTGKTIHFNKRGTVTGHKFEYGYDKGLRGGLTRTNVDSKSAFSILYVTGSDQNLPVGYRSGQPNLQLPLPMEYIQGPKYGDEEIEAVINFPDIKPERIGTISSVTSPFVFSDSGIDFDLNEPGRLLPGVSVKVSFLTGNLAGNNFEIAKGGYNHATRTVTIIKNEVEKALQLPSDLMKPAVGDTYFFFDLVMPASYISDAENRVKVRGQEYFDQYSPPRVAYDVPPDPFYFARNNITLPLGDYVNVKDTDIGIDKDIRVNSFERDLHNPYKYPVLRISDLTLGSGFTRQIYEAEKISKALNVAQINNIQRSKQNWKTSQELLNKYFDPGSEQIFTEAISPTTLRALMIKTGDASQQLVLVGLNFTSNYQQDVNKIRWTPGQLVHTTIAPDPVTWNIPGGTISGLDPGKVYYIYAKCNRTSAAGNILLSDTQIKVDQDPTFYHFWIGIANSVIDNYRNLKSVYGSVSIYGRTIEGGIVVGNNLEINLDEGYILGKVTFAAGSSGYHNLTDKPDLSLYTDKDYFDTVIGGLQSQIDGTIESFFEQYDPLPTNYPANEWDTEELKSKHGNDTFSNTDTGESWRWVFEGSQWIWKVIADTATQQALIIAGQALSAADGKIRNFLVQPFTPYDVGDLWSNGTDLLRCLSARETGPFNAADWGKATIYDSTQVVIDNGIVTAGTVELGNSGGINAGITGNGSDPTSVRFWAGNIKENKEIAPFRALQDGTVYMTKAVISGNITIGTQSGNTADGYTAGWQLSQGAILSDGYSYPALPGGNNFALLRGSSRYTGDKYNEFAFGTELIPSSTGGSVSQIGYIKNRRPKMGVVPGYDDYTNIALELAAEGSNKNVALYISSGDVNVKDGTKVYKGLNGVVNLEGNIPPGATGYQALRIIKGLVVEYGFYNISTGIIS